MISSRRADILMLFITLIWGATFPFIKNALLYTSANWFVAIRFLLAALILLPFVIKRLKNLTWPILLMGAILGVLNGFGYYAQTIGLKTIDSSQSAFITSTTVIIIPLLLPFFKLGNPTKLELLAVIVCIIGIYILTGADIHAINLADGWTFICALTTAISVLFLQKVSSRIEDFVLFAFIQILFAGIIPLASGLYHQQTAIHFTVMFWLSLLYCATLATVFTFYIQSRYQQYTNPTKVGLIFSMEPVFATFFAYFFNHEKITASVLIGGTIVLLSLLLAEAKNWRKVNG